MSSTTSLAFLNRMWAPQLSEGLRIEARAVNSTTARVRLVIKVKVRRAVKFVPIKVVVDFKTSKCARKDPRINPLIVSKIHNIGAFQPQSPNLHTFYCLELQIAGAASLQRERELTSLSELS